MTSTSRARYAPSDVSDVLRAVLQGDVRGRIVDHALAAGDLPTALARLRAQMKAHVFRTASNSIALDGTVHKLDGRTRRDGFHVLLEWNHISHRFIEDEVYVLALDHFAPRDAPPEQHRPVLALLLDYYFLHLLALLVMRAWDAGDPGANMDLVTGLLADLQGPSGSGRRFVDDAGALIFIAISRYEPDDDAYPRFVRRLERLDAPHRLEVARVGGPLLGGHLRWGFPALYGKSLTRMRVDNVADYPWVFFSLVNLIQGYAQALESGAPEGERRGLAEALLGGLTPDPWAMLGELPAPLATFSKEQAEFRRVCAGCRGPLLEDFRALRPSSDGFTPLAFDVNFPHNALIAEVILSLAGESIPNRSLNELLRHEDPTSSPEDSVGLLAQRLGDFAAARPARHGGRWVPMIAYDRTAAEVCFEATVQALERTTALTP